jgi:hypothetical protein
LFREVPVPQVPAKLLPSALKLSTKPLAAVAADRDQSAVLRGLPFLER